MASVPKAPWKFHNLESCPTYTKFQERFFTPLFKILRDLFQGDFPDIGPGFQLTRTVWWGTVAVVVAFMIGLASVEVINHHFGLTYSAYTWPVAIKDGVGAGKSPPKLLTQGCKPKIVAATSLLFSCSADSERVILLDRIITLPNSHELGKAATAFITALVEPAASSEDKLKPPELRKSETPQISCSGSEEKATCWRGSMDLRVPLLEAGLAVLPSGDNEEQKPVVDAQQHASEARRGIWWDRPRWSTLGHKGDPIIWRAERDAELSNVETTPASFLAGWLTLVAGSLQIGVAVGAGYWFLHTKELVDFHKVQRLKQRVTRALRRINELFRDEKDVAFTEVRARFRVFADAMERLERALRELDDGNPWSGWHSKVRNTVHDRLQRLIHTCINTSKDKVMKSDYSAINTSIEEALR